MTDARDRLGLGAPGTDLLYSNPYQGLIEDAALDQDDEPRPSARRWDRARAAEAAHQM